MPGERILVVDSSSAIQEIAKNSLAEAGYKVHTGSNGMAALANPELAKYDMVILDSTMEGVDGYTATREIKTDSEAFHSLVLLLISEDIKEDRSDPVLRGANGYMLKPFSTNQLVAKVQSMLEERELSRQTQQYLDEAANRLMTQLAEEHIQKAVENKTQLIVERAIQGVVSQIDQRATQEVNQRVTQLTAEREQELVRMTVHEVAKSMVEKLAERKVNEAIDTTLREATEKAVKRAADKNLPSQIRERIKDSLELILPREVNAKIQVEVEKIVPEIYGEMQKMFDSVASKVVQRAARDKLPELIDKQLNLIFSAKLPPIVREVARQELAQQARKHVEPMVNRSKRNTIMVSLGISAVTLLIAGLAVAAQLFNWIPIGQ